MSEDEAICEVCGKDLKIYNTIFRYNKNFCGQKCIQTYLLEGEM
jgi:hypothetical protein